MAGRPQRRAAREAERAAALLAGVSMPAPPGQITTPHGADRRPVGMLDPAYDREALATWWRDHLAAMERSTAQRRQLLADVREHPSPIFQMQARAFGSFGMPRDVAAVLLQMSEAEFDLHYGGEYTIGSAEVFMQVSQNFTRIALSSNDRVAVKAATEFLNRRGGEEWRPPAQKLEIDDSRKPKNNVIDSSAMSYQDRQLMRGIILRATGKAPAGLIPVPIEAEADGEAE